MLQQHTLTTKKLKSRKRIGRGNASGSGTTAGRGTKGQSSRSGGKRRPGFEGGQTPLIQKMPKLPGFTHPHAKKKEIQIINLATLEEYFAEGDTVTKADLKAKGLIKTIQKPVKLLGNGSLKKKLTLEIDKISSAAEAAFKKTGGEIKLTS